MPVHQMNRSAQQSLHDTILFSSNGDDNGIGKKKVDWGFLFLKENGTGDSLKHLLVAHSSEFAMPHSLCDAEKLQLPRDS